MAKFLLFLVVLAVIYAVVRASRRRVKPPPGTPGAVPMVQCAHCGLHFPRDESIGDGAQEYCCADHRRLGARP